MSKLNIVSASCRRMAAPGPGGPEEGPPLSELESLQLKANQITDDSLDSTRRMIQMCEDVSTLYLIAISNL